MWQILARTRLEFSSLSVRAQTVRVVKWVALTLTLIKLISSFSEIRAHWAAAAQQLDALDRLDPKYASEVFSIVTQFVLTNWELLLAVAFTLFSKLIDAHLSKSILKTTRDDEFINRQPFHDLPRQLGREGADGARVETFGSSSGWTDPKINRLILKLADGNQSMTYAIRKGIWLAYDPKDASQRSPKGYLRSYVIAKALDNDQRLFNGSKVRLCNDIGAGTIELQRTDYLSSLMSDAVAFRSITSASGSAVTYSDGWSSFLRGEADGTYRLRPFADTKVSNQLGVSTFAFTSDGYILLVYQTRHNAHSMGKIAPSGSGSFDWEDVEASGSRNLLDVVRYAAARELLEESGALGYGDLRVSSVASSYILPYAFARLIHRAGKPDFFCVAYLPLTMHELQKLKPKRFERTYTEKSLAHDGSCVDRTLDLKSELIRLCDHYSMARVLSAEEKARSFGLSYQVLHGLSLLKQALEDSESGPLIIRFLTTHLPGQAITSASKKGPATNS